MDFEAQDSTKLIILMIAGAAFAGAGLWLLLKPKPSGSSAKIELFGLKFESSSAGLLVFLIGAAFLVIPLFVPEKTGGPRIGGGSIGEEPADPVGGQAASVSNRAAVVLPDAPGIEEVEPNERVQQANQLNVGATVGGKVRKGDFDWYVIPLQAHQGKRLVVTLRHVDGGPVYGEVFDADEQRDEQLQTSAGADVGRVEISGSRAYVRVQPNFLNKPAEYELTSRVEEF
ncbi:hypothetical protein [Sedimentitalea todarodis]|uniref:Uncharacterized protein n=1 Tax=Sedimentitalea todarodis TaxID=1631240 RepID=A0ABU3VBB2_9RHOB|nr:hypothetical protein [Sedimentitalea todarodis]MDU9003473.1 hypothetical protein [Sedimentitalea todarodis]